MNQNNNQQKQHAVVNMNEDSRCHSPDDNSSNSSKAQNFYIGDAPEEIKQGQQSEQQDSFT